MTNIALIIAGGVGSRMHQAVPKQFMTVFDKPIIAYTMEKFEEHPAIDVIAVVCLEGWGNVLASYAKQYGISKLKHIIPAGSVGQESIRNGIMELQNHYKDDDFILVHDGNRPLVSRDIISDNIVVAEQMGNAIASIPCQEAILETLDGVASMAFYQREKLRRTQTPHCFRLIDLVNAHKEAQKRGINNTVASCTLMIELGKEVYFSNGSEQNIKITTQDDIDIFKALVRVKC